MDIEQAQAYNELKEHYRQLVTSAVVSEGINKASLIILEALLKLRQTALFPSLVKKDFADDLACKLAALKNLCEDIIAQGDKVLIFSLFVMVLDKIRSYLRSENIRHAYLSGATVKRQQEIERFRNDESVQVFLISLKAGGMGINLTEASYVILFDPWWNPAVENQAVDRAHRMGQQRQVTVYKLITTGTIEEKILTLQERKKLLVESLISSESGGLTEMTAEDIQELFS